MPKGYSLHIGLNQVDPNSKEYGGWKGELKSCEADAIAMQEIAKSLNYYKTRLLLTAEATRTAFFTSITTIRKQLNSGDLFLLTFSGHGNQVLDSIEDEIDGYDETWCFYDGQVLDDEIHELLKTFSKGVRIVIISDSDFSGTIIKGGGEDVLQWGRTAKVHLEGVFASVILISSSQQFEYSGKDTKNSHFIEVLMKVWDNGDFEGNYTDFYETIVIEMPFNSNQTPNHLIGGIEDEVFFNSKPFSIPPSISGSQSKNQKLIKPSLEAQADFEKAINKKLPTEIELFVDRDFDTFTREDANNLLGGLKYVFTFKFPLKIIRIEEGSVKITIELDYKDAVKLITSVAKAKYDYFEIEKILLKSFISSDELKAFLGKGEKAFQVFKKKMQDHIGVNKLKIVLYELQNKINKNSPKHSESLGLMSRYFGNDKAFKDGIIPYDTYLIYENQIRTSIIEFVNSLNQSDLL